MKKSCSSNVNLFWHATNENPDLSLFSHILVLAPLFKSLSYPDLLKYADNTSY